MESIDLKVILDPKLPSFVNSVVGFGEFTTEDPTPETSIYQLLELPRFHRDLILGRPFPLVFVSRGLANLGTIFAIALFLKREIAINPLIPGLVAAVDLVDQYGVGGMAHIDRDLARFFRLLRAYLSDTPQSSLEVRLNTALEWIYQYVDNGSLPALTADEAHPNIIDRGTNGFVLAEVERWGQASLEAGWEELYRTGYLRGAVFSPMHKESGRRMVLGARKSGYLSFNLQLAAQALNEAEESMGEPAEWFSDGMWLRSPPNGTLIPISALTQLLVRL